MGFRVVWHGTELKYRLGAYSSILPAPLSLRSSQISRVRRAAATHAAQHSYVYVCVLDDKQTQAASSLPDRCPGTGIR